MPVNSISFRNYSAGYNGKPVVKGISLEVQKGERFCILGPSGGGKTTLLNSITGIAKHSPGFFSSGEVEIGDNRKAGNDNNNIGYVFQDLALFPHLSVMGNLKFPLKIRKTARPVIAEETEKILAMLKLGDKKHSSIQNLSGGEKQRVALGRALICKPAILCLDEPLKGLDRVLKYDFMNRLMDIHDELNFTLVFVTHDMEEANYMSDRIGILEGGEIRQLNTPAEIHLNPVSLNVARYSGPVVQLNIFCVRGLKELLESRAGAGGIQSFGFRPDALEISRNRDGFSEGVVEGVVCFGGKVRECRFTGKSHITWIQTGSDEFWIETQQYQRGDDLQFRIPLQSVYY